MVFLKLAKLGLLPILIGIIFQRRVVDTVKDLPPSDSRLNRGQTTFNSPCLLGLSLISAFNSYQHLRHIRWTVPKQSFVYH